MSATKAGKALSVRNLMSHSIKMVHSPEAFYPWALVCLFRGGRHEVVHVDEGDPRVMREAQRAMERISAAGGSPVGFVGWCGECRRTIGPPMSWLEGAAYRRAEACLGKVQAMFERAMEARA